MNQVIRHAQIRKIFIHIRSSLWFVPALIISAMSMLSMVLIEIDYKFGEQFQAQWPRLIATQADGAREMLSVIAGSMATVAGVVFSITIVALSLASTQYTSRVLRNFMRDRTTQVVLGVFIGVYIYCLLVLRTISTSNGEFVPAVAVFGGLVLALLAVAFFIFFIHHISASIQASEIAASITRETLRTIDCLFTGPLDPQDEEDLPLPPDGMTWQYVPANMLGYIESVDIEELLQVAQSHATVLRMERCVGEFVAPGRPLVSIALDHPPDQSVIDEVNRSFAVASYRTIEQDAAFGIRQLVDVSLKALSPGINDTTTAVTCIEHLTVLLERCAQRRMVVPCSFVDKQLRVIPKGPGFDDLVCLSFSQILEIAQSNTEILLQVLTAIERIGQATANRHRIAILRQWVGVIDEMTRRNVNTRHALQRLDARLEQVRLSLDSRALGQFA